MYQNIPTKCLTGEVRMSYVNLVQPKQPLNGGEPKYSVALLIPKTDKATIEDIKSAIQAAYDKGVTAKWGGKKPQIDMVLRDGDAPKRDGSSYGEEAKGHYVLNAKSSNKPQVVGIDNIRCELAPNDIYSGMYARVTINFYPFAASGNNGVGCGLGNVLKTRDGEPLGGGASAASDFDGLEVPATTSGMINPITGLPM